MTSLGVYGIILAGWASNSKYAFLGAMRAAAQVVSYEISMGFALVGVLIAAGSLNLTDIVMAQSGNSGLFEWFWLPLLPLFVVYWVSGVAETNRAPFDVVEGESEIVAGHMVEYSGAAFALFYGPVHFLIVREIVSQLPRATDDVPLLVDLGCGTGAAGAAWASSCGRRPRVVGMDRNAWALQEASRTYRALADLQPDNASWWAGYAMSRDALGDVSGALSGYARARQLGGLDARVLEHINRRTAVLQAAG